MSIRTITLDPITRMSGFLEVKAYVEHGKVVDAITSGLLYRGFETMLKGRWPLDAIYFTERICGICSTAHSYVSTLALEDALKISPSENDWMIRDFMHCCEFLQNHLRHLYLYVMPDYVDQPEISVLSPRNHSDFRLPGKASERMGENYVKAIKFSRLSHELLALFGGKAPHNHGIFVGGVTVSMDPYKILKAKHMLGNIKRFIDENLVEDVQTIGRYYGDYYKIGGGYGNFLSYGLFPDGKYEGIKYVDPGVMIDGNTLPLNVSNIEEDESHVFNPSDFDPQNMSLNKPYSFTKAVRYDGRPMEVGPLARMKLSGEYKGGASTMDRLLARAMECRKVCQIAEMLINRIQTESNGQKVYEIPAEATGMGLSDTTRGALMHKIEIKNSVIEGYNIITPTVWNGSPRDSKNQPGVMEKALIGTTIEKEEYPVEIGRIIRSFDPCVSCSTHVISNKRGPVEMIML